MTALVLDISKILPQMWSSRLFIERHFLRLGAVHAHRATVTVLPASAVGTMARLLPHLKSR